METPNLDYLDALAGDDLEFRDRFLNIVKAELPEETDAYYENLKKNELKAASEDVHKLKHKINILGLNLSYDIAARYEEELREGKTDMQSDFAAILSTMENYIKTI